MSDRELAFGLLKENINVDLYFRILERIKEEQSETLKGKLEELLEDYDSKPNYCDYDRIKFIEDIRSLLDKENK